MIRTHSFSLLAILAASFAITLFTPLRSRAQSWTPDTAGLSVEVESLAIAPNGDMFAGTIIDFSPTSVYHYASSTHAWTLCPPQSNGVIDGPVYGFNSKGTLYVGGDYEQFSSSNIGSTWAAVHIDGSSDPQIDPNTEDFAFAQNGNMFVAVGQGDGTEGTSMFASADYGATWFQQGVEGTGHVFPTFVAYDSNTFKLYSGTPTQLYESTGPTGEFWNPVSLAPSLGSSVHFAFGPNNVIVAGGTNGLWITTNDWATSTSIMQGNSSSYYALAISPNGTIFAGLSSGGIQESTDNGADWTDISSNIASVPVYALALRGDGMLFAGTNNGVFQIPEAPSGVSESPAPGTLTLDEVSPNPVVTTAQISFSVPTAGPVSVRVFDATGREVSTLANGFYSPGNYNVTLDARGLPNGAYFYRLTAGDASAARMFVIAR